MIHFLLFLGIFILFILLFAVILILRVVFGGISSFRNILRSVTGNGGNNTNNSSGNSRNGYWQYTYRRGGSSSTSSKETVVDNRDPNEVNRKIFNKSDGEYVDFEEVK